MLEDLLKKGLFGQNRPERCIPDCVHLAQTPKVSPLSLERQYVAVCMSPLRLCKCTQGIHPDTQASSVCFKTNGVENNNLSRRDPDYVPISRPSIDTCSNNTESFEGPRVCIKLRKVLFGNIPSKRVSCFQNKLTNPSNSALKRQSQKYTKEVSKSFRQPKPISSRIIKVTGAPNFFH